MKKSKRWLGIVLIGCMALGMVTGCAKKDSSNDTSATVNLENTKEEKLDLDNTSLEYKEREDAQTFLYGAEVTKGETGYYYWDEMGDKGLGMLMYYDTASGKCVPLCNKANCQHDNTECNAYFNRAGEEGDYFDRTYIQYYDGSVYIIGYDSEAYVNLYQVAADGSSWKKCMQLYKVDMASEKDENTGSQSTTWTPPRVVIHRGYVYYLVWNESTPRIRRMKLGGKDTETIFESTGERPSIDWLKFYGDHLFFCLTNYEDDTYEKFQSGIIDYNLKTNKTTLVKKGKNRSFVVYEQKLYYITNDSVNCFDLLTESDQTIVKNGGINSGIAVDSKYVYLYSLDEHTLKAYSLEGESVTTVIDKDVDFCWMGDDQYFFARGNGVKEMIDLSEVINGNGKWKAMK